MVALVVAAVLLVAAAANTCQPLPPHQCLRGGGKDTFKEFDASAPESQSPAACCAACADHYHQCQASQLISKGGSEPAVCWLLSTQSVKPSSPDDCNATIWGPPAPVPPPSRFNRTSYSGVWIQHGDPMDFLNASFLVGGDLAVKWTDVEVADGVWDWTATDQLFNQYAAAGFYIETALMVGQQAPSWIYKRSGGNASVPEVIVDATKGKGKVSFPYYLDATYRSLFLRALHAFADHLAGLPASTRKWFSASQAMYGSTGDDTPWHGTPEDDKYEISTDQWNNFTMSTVSEVCALYRAAGLSVLWNPGIELDHMYYLKACPGSYFKSGMESHGVFINYELDDLESGRGPVCRSEGVHCRGEDWPFETTGAFQQAPAWSQYWHLLEMLHFSLDMPGLSEPTLAVPDFWPFYDMFNRYAGSTRPPASNWVGGICALRDGLDSADTARFPEATYGAAAVTNGDRMLAIAKAFAAFGAEVGDVSSATASAMASRQGKKLNDVGWRVLPGNLGNGLLTQLAPNETSIGWWRVGPTSQGYGRYARGFEAASGKTAMSFVLDTQLWGGLPLRANSGVVLQVRVTYFDSGHGAFTIAYDNAGGACSSTTSVSVGDSGEWKSISFAVTDAVMGRSCGSRHADIVITSTTPKDVILHAVEVYRIDAKSKGFVESEQGLWV